MNPSPTNAIDFGLLYCRAVRTVLALACALGAWLALACSPAVAKVIHTPEGSFDGHETAAGSFVNQNAVLQGIAADNSGASAGDVYVWQVKYFTFISSVYKFNKDGKLISSFGDTEPTPNGELLGKKTPQGGFGALSLSSFRTSRIAVDSSAGAHQGDLYVADIEHGVIDRFSGSGAFQCQITARPPKSRSAAEEKAECNKEAAGSEVPGTPEIEGTNKWIEPAGIAVDPANGSVYVADAVHNAIDEFNEAGEYVGQITDTHSGEPTHISEPSAIALDPSGSGHLYVLDGGSFGGFGTEVVELSLAGKFEGEIAKGEEPKDIALDPLSTHLYVQANHGTGSEEYPHRIEEYDSTGRIVSSFAGNVESGEGPLAVGSGGRVYRGREFGGAVDMYGPDIVVPNVTTQPASEVQETSAVLHGHLDPDTADGGGPVTTCQFEYGPTKAYGETVPCVPHGPYTGPQDVSSKLERLRPQTTYHFRLEAAKSNMVPGTGEDQTFTSGGPPSVDNQAAEALTTSADVRAHINPWGHDTTCQLQYVNAASFQTSQWAKATTVSCSPEHLGSGFGDVTAKVKLTGLPRATAYHYRFLATNQAGLSGHPEGTFETYGIRKVSMQFLKSSIVTDNFGSKHWEAGEPETPLQAGAHPYELVTTVTFSETTMFFKCTAHCKSFVGEEAEVVNNTALNTKDIKVDLPPGVIGNPSATPKCNRYLVEIGQCPADTQVGVIEVFGDYPVRGEGGVTPLLEESEKQPCPTYYYCEPIYNLEPSEAAPAEFAGFIEGQAPAWIPFHVRTGSDYGVSAAAVNITGIGGGVRQIRTRVWGVPASPTHEAERECTLDQKTLKQPCPDTEPQKPLLINPTACNGPLTVTASADSWQEPGQYVKQTTELPGFTGCGKLKFEPTFEAQPTSSVADSPTGLHADLHVPQNEEPLSLATADVRDAKVVLPAGVTVDPSSADGLAACSEAQIGYLPQRSAEVGRPQFTPGPAECPDASKIGTVEVDSRLVDHPLPGAVYVAQQGANPFGSLLALYVTVYDAKTGVVIKLPGRVTADPVTGQLTTTFDEDPQLPFEDFKVDLFSGSRASLTTPLVCGAYSIATDLMPWSSPEGADATPSSLPFTVANAPGGGACAASDAQAPNTPGFDAGTASPIAGSYSPFVLHLKREDGSQRFSGLNLTLPPGLTGKIAGIERCPQAAIEAARARSHEGEGALELAHPSCPAGSEVGVVHVGAGSGAPDYVTGRAYFAGPYNGAPFSLVIVTPAVAGPFDLGAVMVRAGLYIDPNTAQVTVSSDPFPTILDGIPLDIRSVSVDMNRKEFTLNPTNCSVMSVTGQESSTVGQTAALSDRFQAGGCTTLPFHPSFTASTSGKNSKAGGASLTVKVAQHPGEANIHKVNLQLPIQLPSRLSTLQKACPAAVFEANPAGCPAASVIGTATAHTPLLNVPLTGPAYLVSHGGEAFPDVEFLLQGEGVHITLDGKTDIKKGITYSHFETVPDAPISSFETVFPQGPSSILGTNVPQSANYSLCGQNLTIPTTLTGQNGAIVNQNTKIAVTGCAKAKKKTLTRAQKLKAALKACRNKDRYNKYRREACERQAHRRYGPLKQNKKK
jgi:DNA-binding beta-propeller fold protein YncE